MAKIVICFPGIGYHCDKPLLYYGIDLAAELGYENIRRLSYSYDGGNIRGNQEKMEEAFHALYRQAEESLSEICWADYEEIVFLSKSVGTIIATAYAQKHDLQVKYVLYTPLERTFSFPAKNAIGFIGTKDPWSDVGEVLRLAEEQGVPMTVYEGLNHSLEEDDTLKNLEIVQDVMRKTKVFLAK